MNGTLQLARFTYSRTKFKTNLTKVKKIKNCQKSSIRTQITSVCICVRCVKYSKVDIMKAILKR